MTNTDSRLPRLSRRGRMGIGAALLLAVGVAGGAGAVSLTRATIEMAPMVARSIASLPTSSGIVTIKGRVVEIFGDRIVIQDGTGRTMIDIGRQSGTSLGLGQAVTVQGRYDDGQLRASYLVAPDGRILATGPAGGPPRDPRGPQRPHHDGPPAPPPGGPRGEDAPPPPPAGCDRPGAAAIPNAPQPPALVPAVPQPNADTTRPQAN